MLNTVTRLNNETGGAGRAENKGVVEKFDAVHPYDILRESKAEGGRSGFEREKKREREREGGGTTER